MNYLIDTNICIYIMNQHPVAVIEKFKQFDTGEVGISAISVSELQYGVAKSTRKKENQQRLNEFLVPFEIVPYDRKVAKYYGEIRAQLEKQGIVIGPLDMLIAAHALSRDLVLVTNNGREFERVAHLNVENWVG